MRGHDEQTGNVFSYLSPEQRIPADHPLRAIRRMTDRILARLSPKFTGMYSKIGRPSIAPEKLLRALLLQVLYTVRSERMLMEQLEYNLLFRWFVGLNMDDAVWDPTVFSKNRDRLLAADVAALFFARGPGEARARDLVSDEHFTVDGTLLEAWAGLKSLQKDRRRQYRRRPTIPAIRRWIFTARPGRNATHASKTDPEAKLARKGKGKEAKLSYSRPRVDGKSPRIGGRRGGAQATGTRRPDAALTMVAELPGLTVASPWAAIRTMTRPTSCEELREPEGHSARGPE